MGLMRDTNMWGEIKKYYGIRYFEKERIRAVLPFCRGVLLDIGCGNNELVRTYGNGIGIDVFDWGCGATIIEDSSKLPFDSESFNTVSIIAALNHIPERLQVLEEANRVLKEKGRLIITMINPIVGFVAHKAIFWTGEEKLREAHHEERLGMWPSEVMQLCIRAGYNYVKSRSFLFGFNKLFLFSK